MGLPMALWIQDLPRSSESGGKYLPLSIWRMACQTTADQYCVLVVHASDAGERASILKGRGGCHA
jgi:hypothetical protein